MPALDWHSRDTNLTTALATATGADAARANDIQARLRWVGNIYDGVYTTAVDNEKAQTETAYSGTLASWQTDTSAVHGQVDHAARYAESLQVAVPPGLTVYNGAVLSPSVGIPFDGTETPTGTATRTLNHSGASALLLTALDAGTFGNTVEVMVANATDGNAAHFDLSVRRGAGYVETYQSVVPGASFLGGSRLLASPQWYAGNQRPDNVAWTALAGAFGGSHAALTARLERARALPGAAAVAAMLADYSAALDAQWLKRPTLYYGPLFDGHIVALVNSTEPAGIQSWSSGIRANSQRSDYLTVHGVADRLAPIMTEADAWLALYYSTP